MSDSDPTASMRSATASDGRIPRTFINLNYSRVESVPHMSIITPYGDRIPELSSILPLTNAHSFKHLACLQSFLSVHLLDIRQTMAPLLEPKVEARVRKAREERDSEEGGIGRGQSAHLRGSDNNRQYLSSCYSPSFLL